MAVGHALLHHFLTRPIVIDPVDAETSVKLRPESGGEKAIAEEPPRGVQNKNDELRLGNREPVRPHIFRHPADYGIHIFDVVYHRSIGMTEAIVNGRPILVYLRVGD